MTNWRPALLWHGVSKLRTRLAGGHRAARSGLILMYHRVADVTEDPWRIAVTPARFAEHLEVLHSAFRPMSLPDFLACKRSGAFPRRAVAVTFDDGYLDNFVCAKPLLQQFRIPATFFMISGYVDSESSFWWDDLLEICLGAERLPERLEVALHGRRREWDLTRTRVTRNRRQPRRRSDLWREPRSPRRALYRFLYWEVRRLSHADRLLVLNSLRQVVGLNPSQRTTMTSHEVLRLAENDLFEIGAHTITHPELPSLLPDAQLEEIRGSKEQLEGLVGRRVNAFAYPYGAFDSKTLASVREAGFTYSLSASPGAVRPHGDSFRLPRLNVENWGKEAFERELSAWFSVN